MEVIILAAGLGSRLGKGLPKCLTIMDNGKTILQMQVENIRAVFGDVKINIIIGFKGELIEEYNIVNNLNLNIIYNADYDIVNTSKSLLHGIKFVGKDKNVLWLNGDVVFSVNVLMHSLSLVTTNQSFITVNTESVSDEEIKYTLDSEGYIDELSKKVNQNKALGEAVGINFINSSDVQTFKYWLKKVNDSDYFEKGLEESIKNDKIKLTPYDISAFNSYAVEVDFESDLAKANNVLV